MFRILADLVVIVHLAFVLFVVAGGVLVWRWPRLAWVHLPAAAWGVVVECAGLVCPLTPLELWLRSRAGGGVYEGGFVEQYLLPVLYPPTLGRELQWLLGGVVAGVNLAVYAALGGGRRRLRRRRSGSISAARDS